MSTKTAVSATDELAKLTEAREKAHAIVHQIRRDRDAYDNETEAMRAEITSRRIEYPEEHEKNGYVKDGTTTAKLVEKTKARMIASNPVQPKLDKAAAIFQDAERRERFYRVDALERLIEEAAPPGDAEEFRAAWLTIASLVDSYCRKEQEVRQIFVDMPVLDGKDVAIDARVQTWGNMAAEALDTPLFMPRVSDQAAYRLDTLRESIEAEKNE